MLSETADTLFRRLIAIQQGSSASAAEENLTSLISSVSADLSIIAGTLGNIWTARSAADAIVTTGTEESASMNGKAVAGILSLDHMRAVYTSIELLWLALLKPFVIQYLPFFVEQNLTYPRTLVLNQDAMKELLKESTITSNDDIWKYYNVLFDIVFCPSFSNTMYKRFVKRIIVLHVLVSNKIQEHAAQSKEILRAGLANTVDEECFRQFVIAIRELMHESGGAHPWLLQDCGRLLSEYIMFNDGLKYVLQGYLDGTFADRNADIIQEKIARTIASVPNKIPKADCYKLLAPQVSALLFSGYQEKDNMLLQVCSKICNRLAAVTPILFKKLILLPILQPLLNIGIRIDKAKGVISNEYAVARAVELPFQLLVSSPPSPQLLSLIQQTGYVYATLSLHAFLATKAQSSGLMVSCSALCKFLLERDPPIPEILTDLRRAMLCNPAHEFCMGSAGGIEIRNEFVTEKSASATLFGGMKSQLSALLPPFASDLTKESFEQLISLCMEQNEIYDRINEGNITDDSGIGENAANISRALTMAHSFELLGDCNNSAAAKTVESPISKLLSELFLTALSGYFRVNGSDHDRAPSEDVDLKDDERDRRQNGVMLLALQSTLPMPLLLSDGLKIIQIMKLVLEAYTVQIIPSEVYAVSSAPPHPPMRSGPLIEVVSSSPMDPESEDAVEDIDASREVGEAPVETESKAGEEDKVFLTTSLSMLSTMLAFGSAKRADLEETALRSLLPALQQISAHEIDVTTADAATDVAVAIMTRGVVKNLTNVSCCVKADGQLKGDSDHINGAPNDGAGIVDVCIFAAEEFLGDEHPAMRALGVRHINTSLKSLKQGITDTEIEVVVNTLVNQLEDADSFVYLSVIHTIRALFDHNRKRIVTMLMNLFENADAWQEFRHNKPNMTSGVNIVRRRVLLGEALMFGVKRAGELVPYYANDIIYGCMRVLRAENTKNRPVQSHITGWDMQKMTITKDSLGPVTRGNSAALSPKIIEAGLPDTVIEAQAVDSILLRQSALSLMAEVVATAGFGSSRYLDEVIQLASDVLAVEHSNYNAAVAMRRSAAFMIKHIVTGLQQKLFLMKDSGFFMKPLYSRIKMSCNDKDAIVRIHSQSALYALDKHTKQQLFFGQEGGIEADVIPRLRILG